jgi:hypothetical protein
MSIRTKATFNLLAFAIVAAWFVPQHLLGNLDLKFENGRADEIMSIRPHVAGSPAALVDQHDCWTGDGPQGVIPGHVVVTTKNGVTRYAGAVMTGKALDQLFAGEEFGLTIHGFCR